MVFTFLKDKKDGLDRSVTCSRHSISDDKPGFKSGTVTPVILLIL